MSDLESELSSLGLEEYVQDFQNAGYDSWDAVCEMSESDLECLDLRVGHRRKLQREIARRWGWPDAKPLPSDRELKAWRQGGRGGR